MPTKKTAIAMIVTVALAVPVVMFLVQMASRTVTETRLQEEYRRTEQFLQGIQTSGLLDTSSCEYKYLVDTVNKRKSALLKAVDDLAANDGERSFPLRYLLPGSRAIDLHQFEYTKENASQWNIDAALKKAAYTCHPQKGA